MRQLEDSSSDARVILTALEALAHLSWNDDEVREEVAQMEGTPFLSYIYCIYMGQCATYIAFTWVNVPHVFHIYCIYMGLGIAHTLA